MYQGKSLEEVLAVVLQAPGHGGRLAVQELSSTDGKSEQGSLTWAARYKASGSNPQRNKI